jgi:sugar lactone lactonase YvrE
MMLLASAGQAQDAAVYTDALAPGWSDWSYPNPAVNFANGAPVHAGAASIAVTFDAPFAALSLRTAAPLDGADYSAIRFWIHGGAAGIDVDVFTQATDDGPGSAVASVSGPAGTWTQVVVPLAALDGAAPIARINLQDNTGALQPTFYVDDVVVVAAAGSAARDDVADRVLGQAAFDTAGAGTTATTLNGPASVAVGADGRLFVVDYENSRVLSWPNARTFASGAAATLVLGQASFTSANPSSAIDGFDHPEGVTVDPSGNVFVADTGNHRVMVFSPPLVSGMNSTLRFGSFDCAFQAVPNNLFCFPRALASDSEGNLYLGDEFHDRVLLYRTPMTTDVVPDKQLTGLVGTRGVAVDASGNVYASDSDNDLVRQYDTPLDGDTVPDRTFGSGSDDRDCFAGVIVPPTATSLACPIDLATDAAGNLYVSDLYHHRVLAYLDPLADNVPDMVFGQNGSFTTGTANNGGLSAASIRTPLGLAFDAGGNLYLADFDNNRVLAYDVDLIFADGFE